MMLCFRLYQFLFNFYCTTSYSESLYKLDGTGVTYTYNSDGIRTQKTVGTVTTDYTLEGDKVVYETNGTDAFWYYYDESGASVSFH